ncbi:MAG: TauD/TfdA family dioxygenase [Acidimicrobiia bacterium]|nr:TauD/TfdA family dioxygenase [Acidimicrobiia bacterium]
MIEISRSASPLGATVTGVDVRVLDDAAFATIRQAFADHHVLAFPDQELDPGEQKAFAARWGPLQRHPYNGTEAHPEVMRLENLGKAKDPNEHWHSDMSYEPVPPKLTMLHALEAPELGGETAFANQHLAFEALSPALQDHLRQLRAVHTAEGLARLYGQDPAAAPRAVHPVVRVHEERGDEALYVCRAFTQRFDGWRRSESRGLLEFLFEHSARPDFQARHRWRPGDLVLWDNRSVLHYAVHDHGDDPRVMHRVQVEGDRPGRGEPAQASA